MALEKKRPVGRPKSKNPRGAAVAVRLTAAERRKLDAAAKRAGLPLSEFMRRAALEKGESNHG